MTFYDNNNKNSNNNEEIQRFSINIALYNMEAGIYIKNTKKMRLNYTTAESLIIKRDKLVVLLQDMFGDHKYDVLFAKIKNTNDLKGNNITESVNGPRTVREVRDLLEPTVCYNE